jgi:hypothetical protein
MDDRRRITWTSRINARPADIQTIRLIAEDERVAIATVIGDAIEAYLLARRAQND